ncbi:atlastin-2-like [Anneissia japonica]|uniref:atlastin-2-like n=1 Tax=Anneissia japonica TaxID=1529436 RepID=UPI0014256DD9|nr:atlastin-2-like [Anneissia japonica]
MPALQEVAASGVPLQVVKVTDDHTFELCEDVLESILLQDHVKGKKVVVLSVAGAFRKGKSFLLDFFLRYLSERGSEDWMGSNDEPLTGFSWRGGSDRETTGIWMWSDVFICPGPNDKDVAVLLMDTQGAFDTESTVKDCATVFALSTMLSSVQVYNLSMNIQEDDLQHLQLFTEYGRLAMEDNDFKPFQNLMFLVRDWSYPYEAEYGLTGGQQILDKRLQIKENQHKELETVRKHIKDLFKEVQCFLMPHPGLKVASNPKFDGRLRDISDDFRDELKVLAPHLLSSANLAVKEINGDMVKCADLVEYFKAYIKIYQGDELPEPMSMLTATAEANNLSAVAKAKADYIQQMEEICGGDKPYLNPVDLEKRHANVKDIVLERFWAIPKMGGKSFTEPFADQLELEIMEHFDQYVKHNDSKNLFNIARTPITLLIVMIIMYISSAVFGIFGIYSLSNMANLILGLSLLLICAWGYVKYSGTYPNVGVQIDGIAEKIWVQILGPMYKKARGSGREEKRD